MPSIITRGGMAGKAFGLTGYTAAPVYIEDVFSTYLYTGTGATQTITNNINLSTNGGLVWIKSRSANVNHNLFDTTRGATYWLHSNTTDASTSDANSLTAFGTTGFTLGSGNTTGSQVNTSAGNFVSWTFRKQAKFFDVVSYTGTGSARTIAHSLGSTPGMIIVKRTDTSANWRVYHSGLTSASYYLGLNQSAAQVLDTTVWNATAPTSSVFSVGTDATVNASGGTYIAYIYASNAGGFGSAGTDNVITCGSTPTSGTNYTEVNLGWEPQFVLIKGSGSFGGSWFLIDTMRGLNFSQNNVLSADLSSTEFDAGANAAWVTATGFVFGPNYATYGNDTCVYMAIRRGPMKTPTSGTSVYEPILWSGNTTSPSTTRVITPAITSTPTDLVIVSERNAPYNHNWYYDRLRGTPYLTSVNSSAEDNSWKVYLDYQSGFMLGDYANNYSGRTYVGWNVRRAPGFFDVVCYTGTGSATTVSHNLGVAPELIIVKRRNAAGAWPVYSSQLTNNAYYAVLNTTAAQASGSTYWNSTTPTNTVFSIGTAADVNTSTGTYVAYLFATLAGVSKVGSYTGTAAALNIDCGFAAGARFVMIKRTDSTGDWYVYDTARGISASGTNDPYLLMNSTNVEVTNTDYLATYSPGFALTSSGSTTTNVSGGTYIYLAIA